MLPGGKLNFLCTRFEINVCGKAAKFPPSLLHHQGECGA